MPDKTLPRRTVLLRNGLLLALLAALIIWKALGLGQSVLMAVLTVAGLFTVYGIGWLVMRNMDPK